MDNPPDFVVYVVMVKKHKAAKFNPYENAELKLVPSFRNRRKAVPLLRMLKTVYGKENAYIQQYGPYS